MPGRMRRAAAVTTLMWLAGCGGGENGETSQVMLEGDEAVQAVTGVVRSTVATLIALRSESAPFSNEGAFCTGGSVDASCEVENRQSIVRASFDQCRIPAGGGNVVTGDGGLRIQTNEQSACVTSRIPDTATIEIDFDDFEQVLTDASGNELSRSRTDGRDRIVPVGPGCAGRNLMELFDATIDAVSRIRLPGRLLVEGFDARVALQGLQLDQRSTGTPCVRALTAGGDMDVDDRANGLRFSQRLSGVIVRFLEEGEATLVEIDGDLVSGCIGTVTLTTVEPIRLHNATDCPTAGTLRVMTQGRTSEIRYNPQGQVAIDYDSDGQLEVAGSRCDSLAQCSR